MKSIDISEGLYARLEKSTKNNKEEINEVCQRAIEWYLDECENPENPIKDRNWRFK